MMDIKKLEFAKSIGATYYRRSNFFKSGTDNDAALIYRKKQSEWISSTFVCPSALPGVWSDHKIDFSPLEQHGKQ